MHGAIEVVILAAGEARRFGSPKQIAYWKGLPLLQRAINTVLASGKQPWLAMGAHCQEIVECADIDIEQCHLVDVADWSKGLSSSIKTVLTVLMQERKKIKGVVFLLADQPMFLLDDLQKILSAIDEDDRQIICSSYLPSEQNRYKSGHRSSVGVPAYFPIQYFEKLMLLEGDEGAKKVIQENSHRAIRFDGALLDIDTPEDLSLHADKESDSYRRSVDPT